MKKTVKKKIGKADKRPGADPKFIAVERAFAGVKGVSAGKLFSSYGLKVNGKIFAMFGRGRLVVKLPKERVDTMVNERKAQRFDPGHGRLMKEWAAFESGEAEWLKLAREAYQFVSQGKS